MLYSFGRWSGYCYSTAFQYVVVSTFDMLSSLGCCRSRRLTNSNTVRNHYVGPNPDILFRYPPGIRCLILSDLAELYWTDPSDGPTATSNSDCAQLGCVPGVIPAFRSSYCL